MEAPPAVLAEAARLLKPGGKLVARHQRRRRPAGAQGRRGRGGEGGADALGGADYLLVETCQDTRNVKAALLGCERAFSKLGWKLPVAVSGTIEPMGTMLAGQSVEALAASLEHVELLYLGLKVVKGLAPRRQTPPTRSTLSGVDFLEVHEEERPVRRARHRRLPGQPGPGRARGHAPLPEGGHQEGARAPDDRLHFGLPTAGREVLDSVFLYHCVQAGLDMALVNSGCMMEPEASVSAVVFHHPRASYFSVT